MTDNAIKPFGVLHSCHNTKNQAFSILILEDDSVYQRILSYHLSQLGYKVHVAGTIESFWEQLAFEKPDLLVIDMRLPDGTGFGVLHQVREQDKLIPIVVVSSLDKPVERELAYNSGADVFLVKPVHINELLAVVKRFHNRVTAICEQVTVAEQSQTNRSDIWRLIKIDSLLISPNGKQLKLTGTEFAFLEFLAFSDQEASRTTIAHYLKSVRLKDGHGYDGALNTMISRLRKRWSTVDTTPLPIKAIRGTGYAFASHGGLTLVGDRRDDHFNRLMLHHFTLAIAKESATLSDSDRKMALTLCHSIKASVSSYFIKRATTIFELIINNPIDGKQSYEALFHSDEGRAQFITIIIHFVRFLMESPRERLNWLMNVFLFDDAEDCRVHDAVFVTSEQLELTEIIQFLTSIFHYTQLIYDDDMLLEMVHAEFTRVDIQRLLNHIKASLSDFEQQWQDANTTAQ